MVGVNMIEYVDKDMEINPRVTPSIKFTSEEGWYDAMIYIDHIPVAYFGGDGAICALPFETGPNYVNGDESHKVKYLQDRGFQLESRPGWKDGDVIYTIKMSSD